MSVFPATLTVKAKTRGGRPKQEKGENVHTLYTDVT